ncbi:hypothetical protein [Streptomyces yaizuensis]|uniref:Uncharacterized protein n=1 Tax=Streptomyces yaizuensis TaxID=2989713 RepID=A0ABQ5P317_9ACTN|nr:hypothetical protein [Streptomyces sp. YSPA8]GLF96892.1 hypothetical protein SYYSPA8_21365 [Streptomyces sp. YSPA8]
MDDEPVLRTRIGGRTVDLPGTLDGIRAALPEGQREAFDRAVGSAPLLDVPLIAARWGLPQEARDEDDALADQLRTGDFTGFGDLDDEPGDGPGDDQDGGADGGADSGAGHGQAGSGR